MIKRGYWFGSVSGKPTVAFCPINYCNFTCCETSNGYYQLSPVRDNQCRSHRSGIACGSCEEGYTLSFDSIECLDLNECTTGQTILVLALILLYWIVKIVAVFSLMRFKVEIGYFNLCHNILLQCGGSPIESKLVSSKCTQYDYQCHIQYCKNHSSISWEILFH